MIGPSPVLAVDVAEVWGGGVAAQLWNKGQARGVEKACRSRSITVERARWVPRACGHTLEVGVGSGLNLAFYDPACVEKVTAIDPSEPLLARARERVRSAPVPVELLLGQAENLPFPDASFNAVLVTYSLCSVRDPAQALAEMRRVLRPDAELL